MVVKNEEAISITLPELKIASLESSTIAALLFDAPLAELPSPKDFKFLPGGKPKKIWRQAPHRIALEGRFDLTKKYRVKLPDGRIFPLLPEELLDRISSDKPMGLTWDGENATVRFFAPRIKSSTLVVFDKPDELPVALIPMDFSEREGTWETSTDELRPGRLYGYKVESLFAIENIDDVIFADPYSWAVAKRNTWQRESLTVVLQRDVYNLPPLGHIEVQPRDLTIYEAHVKDFSALARSLPYTNRGTYLGAVHDAKGSPLRMLTDLGINTVEWLPLQDYDYYEPTFDDSSLPIHNTWNRYSRNHWGYMPAFYFAPEARYASGFSRKDGAWIGVDGRQVKQMRTMVEKLHEAGLSVIVDVVYNHIAQYGQNPLRQIDPLYSLRHDRKGKMMGESYCGNDLRTERPMIRKLIIESLQHWVKLYGIDGFRFDLAGLIDGGTLDAITQTLKKDFPGIHLIAEPWGGRYDHGRFSKRGWGAWNDLFRDGIRGYEPERSAFMFGKWGPHDNDHTLIRHLTGNLQLDGGPFKKEHHAVNYLACHDGYTLGDFVRLVCGKKGKTKPGGRDACLRMPADEMDLLRFGLFVLFTSRGAVMLHAGDEWARPKFIEASNIEDPNKGTLDHNSYEKDDETNWMDWEQMEYPECEELRDYVKGLIELRKNHPALRIARRSDLVSLASPGEFAYGYRLKVANDDLLILMNANPFKEVTFQIPSGRWSVYADHANASGSKSVGGVRKEKIVVPSTAGALLNRID